MSNDQPLKISPRGSGLDIIIDELMIIPSITDFRGLKNYSEFMKLLKANKINSDILKNWYTSKDKIYSSWLINLYTEIFILDKIRYLGKNIESLTLQKIFPYGITVSEDIPQVIIPNEYKDYNNDRFAYNLMMVASNRNFWYLLTIEEKYELFNLLKINPSIKLKHVSNVDYCNSDLLEDIVRFQFKYDQYFADIIAYGTDITKLPDKDKVYDYSYNELVDRSLDPYRLFVYNNMFRNYDNKKYCYYKYGIISEEQPRAQLGQYIVNTLTPKGSVG